MNGFSNPLPAKLVGLADILALQLGEDSPHVLIMKEAALEIGVLDMVAQAATEMALGATKQAVEQRTLKEDCQRANSQLVLQNRELRNAASN